MKPRLRGAKRGRGRGGEGEGRIGKATEENELGGLESLGRREGNILGCVEHFRERVF